MKNTHAIFVFVIFLFLISTNLKAQEIEVNVTVNVEQIPQEFRQNVLSMENDVERYINNQRFTSLDWEGAAIPVDISIVLAGGRNGVFSARVLIIAKRNLWGQDGGASVTLKLYDEEWVFEYAQGASHSYNPRRFDRFVSLLDFYILTIIGFDLDTYQELGGTQVYEMAKEICRMGASYSIDGYETYSQPGEFTKWNLISELTDLRYEELRLNFFDFYSKGLDYIIDDKKGALETLHQVIDNIAAFKRDKMVGPSVLLQAFFDAKARELAEIFKNYSDHSVYDSLMYLDPSNTTIYEEAMGR